MTNMTVAGQIDAAEAFAKAAESLAVAVLADAAHYREVFAASEDYDALEALDDLIDA